METGEQDADLRKFKKVESAASGCRLSEEEEKGGVRNAS